MVAKLQAMSNEELSSVWDALGQITWNNDEMYDKGAGITMNEWAEDVYSEMCIRGLPR